MSVCGFASGQLSGSIVMATGDERQLDNGSNTVISGNVHQLLRDCIPQVESIATASCRDGEDGKPCLLSEDAVSLRYDPPQTQEPAQPTQVLPQS